MLSRSIIVVGDVNSSNGPVISGSATGTIGGKPVARKCDLVDCPARYSDGRLYGINPIAEGDDSMIVNDQPVALHGHRCRCGCALIGTTTGYVGS